jgi:hypothetical protein
MINPLVPFIFSFRSFIQRSRSLPLHKSKQQPDLTSSTRQEKSPPRSQRRSDLRYIPSCTPSTPNPTSRLPRRPKPCRSRVFPKSLTTQGLGTLDASSDRSSISLQATTVIFISHQNIHYLTFPTSQFAVNLGRCQVLNPGYIVSQVRNLKFSLLVLHKRGGGRR